MDVEEEIVNMPVDYNAFWASLDRRGAGNTTIFVRAEALRVCVEPSAFADFISDLGDNIRFIKTLTYGGTGEKERYVLSARAMKRFSALPWPKECKGILCAGATKSVHEFSRNGADQRSAICQQCTAESRKGLVMTEAARAAAAERQRRCRAKVRG